MGTDPLAEFGHEDMSEIVFLLLLYAAAVVILIVEIFIPSHGVLTVAGLGVLIGAIVKTFEYYGSAAGGMAILASVVGLPIFAVITVKIWPHTRIGRLIAPPNPVYTEKDLGTDLEDLKPLIGQCGKALSPLRPVGTCEFAGRRLECICETGMIEAGVVVQAVGLRGRNQEQVKA